MLVPALQVAGHNGSLQSENGAIFIKKTNRQELEFYKKLNEDPRYGDLLKMTCSFMGTLTESQLDGQLDVESSREGLISKVLSDVSEPCDSDEVTIVLENAVYGYKQPNIIDIKLGSVLYDETADEDKIQRLKQVSETTTSGSMGIRIAGMSVYDPQKDARLVYDRNYGRQLTQDTILEGFRTFFTGDDPQNDSLICEHIVSELEDWKKTIEFLEARFISASVLVIYEADRDEFFRKASLQTQPQDEEDEPIKLITLHLIDFAHSKFTPFEGKDENVLKGINSLISIFDQLEKCLAQDGS